MLAEIFLQLGFILWIGIFLLGVKEGIKEYFRYSDRDRLALVAIPLIGFWVGMFVFFVFGLGML